MKRLTTLLTLLLLCDGSSTFAQDESKKDDSIQAEKLKIQVQKLERQLREAEIKLSDAAAVLASRERKIAKAMDNAAEAEGFAKKVAMKAQRAVNDARAKADQIRARQVSRSAFMEDSLRLQAELARASQTFGPTHPRLLQLKEQLKSTQEALAAAEKGNVAIVREMADQDMKALYQRKLAALKEVEAMMKKSQYKMELQDRMATIEEERAQLETKLKLAQKG